jgi:hypothetical protein
MAGRRLAQSDHYALHIVRGNFVNLDLSFIDGPDITPWLSNALNLRASWSTFSRIHAKFHGYGSSKVLSSLNFDQLARLDVAHGRQAEEPAVLTVELAGALISDRQRRR